MCSESRKTLKVPVTFLQHHRDLGDSVCVMVIIALNLEGSNVRISVHNTHRHQTLHCGISEDMFFFFFLMGSFVNGGMRLGGGRPFLLFYRKFVVWVFLSLADRTRIFKSLDFVDSVETAETGTSLAASPEKRPICF